MCVCTIKAAWGKIKPGDDANVSVRSEVIASLMGIQNSKGLGSMSVEERKEDLLRKLDALITEWRKNPVTAAFAEYFHKQYRNTIGLWCHALLAENLAGHWTNNLLERYHGEGDHISHYPNVKYSSPFPALLSPHS